MGDEVLLVMDFTNFALRHTIYLTNVAAAQLSLKDFADYSRVSLQRTNQVNY